MLRNTIWLALLTACAALAAIASAQQREGRSEAVIEDPLDELLADFAAAVADLDVEKAERLFLEPDDSPAGRSRQQHLDEMRKDWTRAREVGQEVPSLQFKNTRKVIRTEMIVGGPGGPPGGQSSEMEFHVVLTEEGWKIESMESAGEEPRR